MYGLGTEAALVQAAQRSDAAFAVLYERYYPLIFAFVRGRLGDAAAAEDITAHTFVQAYQALGRYEERGAPFGAWLRRIATNALVAEVRRRRRMVPWAAAVAQQACATAVSAEGQPEEWATRAERALRLRAQVGRLTADQQRALWLRFAVGCSVREMAAQLGRSEGATKALLHRALRRLRTYLQPAATAVDA